MLFKGESIVRNRAVVFLLCIKMLLACCAASAQSFDVKLAEAQKTLQSGDFVKAYDMFSALFREQPQNEKVNSGLGQAAFATGRLSHAAMAYERVLAVNPKNDWARLELGRTFFAMQQYEQAQDYFKSVLDRQPPPLVKENIEQFMAHIKTKTRMWDFWGRVDIGAFYDDNVNYGPDSDLIHTTLGLLEMDPDATSRAACGLFGALSLSGVYDIGERGGLALFGDGSFYGTLLDNVHSEELVLYRANAGLQYALRQSLLQMPFSYQYLDRGHAHYMSVYGVRASGLHAFTRDWHGMSRLIAERRDYADLDSRDSWYYALEATGKRYFGPLRHSVDFSAQGFYEDCKEDVYGNNGFELSASGEYRLPWQLMAYLRLRYRNAYYKEREALAPRDRHDRQWQTLAGLNKIISRNWGVDASYQFTYNDSSFDLYDYSRNVVTLSTFLVF